MSISLLLTPLSPILTLALTEQRRVGLNALTRSVALDYGKYGIRANAVAPAKSLERGRATLEADPLEDQACRDCYPVDRYGEPEGVAAAALFLASDEASFVTGIVRRQMED